MQTTVEDTREALLRAAKKLFALKGLDGTTVRELADEAGVNLSLVSYHFNGKEGLYRACLEQFGRRRLEVARRVLQPPRSAEELRVRLGMFVEEVIGCHVEEPELTTLIHRECAAQTSVGHEVFQQTFLKVFETLVEFVRTAQRGALVRDDFDPMISGSLFFGALVHQFRVEELARTHFGRSLREPKYRQKLGEHLVSIFLGGISATGGT